MSRPATTEEMEASKVFGYFELRTPDMTHNQQLDDLRAEIEGMPATDRPYDRSYYLKRSDVLAAISRMQGHLTAMEALEQLVKFCGERANDGAFKVECRQAYGSVHKLATQLQSRVQTTQLKPHTHIWTDLGQGMKRCQECCVIITEGALK